MEMAEAPDLTPGYPSKGKMIGPGWREAWKRMWTAGSWVDGVIMCEDIAPPLKMQPSTLRAVLYRMVVGEILERKTLMVDTDQGPRRHTHFRIKAK